MRIHVIACGVLAIDIKNLAEQLGIEITSEFLEGGLHDTPVELRRRLQEAINQVSARGGCDRIVIGYGVCGRGTIGLRSLNIPLAIPKAQDCIALFLGSDAAYRKEFARFPGTYYISAGWFEEKVQPKGKRRDEKSTCRSTNDDEQNRLEQKYGADNARAISDFMSSWTKNYQRAAFVDTGSTHRDKYASYAKAMAEEFGWKYEALPGDLSLLEKALLAWQTTDEILVVPPHHATVFSAVENTLQAVPLWEKHTLAEAEPPAPTPVDQGEHTKVRLGLGIDAGGTYTDIVLYDFDSRLVLQKAKALTTKWDYTVGIERALSDLKLESDLRIDLVSVSTTLATNAIVEGHGQAVGLLVMPPYGIYEPSNFPHEPKAAITGRLEINGTEIEQIDAEQVRAIVGKMVDQHGVGAFAVSGYAGTVNPAQELQVKAIIKDETNLSVTCGHELSEMLNFRTRADTAVLNARIIPRLEKFLREVEHSLRRRKVAAPIMVVKGDGSLMSTDVARERPIETVLSGPAASVAGAVRLTDCDRALVVDMGGTTSDTAVVENGAVATCGTGARVGGWKTHVKALDMRTIGLGGDSLISYESRVLKVGPMRVSPVSWLSSEQPAVSKALDYIEAKIDDFSLSSKGAEIVALTGHADALKLDDDERSIIDILRERPHSLAELATKTRAEYWGLLRLRRLEEHYIIQRCGLTPTDLLHVQGAFERWDAAAAHRLCAVFSTLSGQLQDDFVRGVNDRIVRMLAVELLKKELDEETDPDRMDDCPVCQTLLANLASGGNADYTVGITLRRPVIGLGAPVQYFLPKAAEMLNAHAIIPHDADVANAIGAITSGVVVSRQVHIRPNDFGEYAVHGLPEPRSFERFEDACTFAVSEVQQIVRSHALSAGTSTTRVELQFDDRVSNASDGTEIFLERRINARLAGPPDIVRLAESL